MKLEYTSDVELLRSEILRQMDVFDDLLCQAEKGNWLPDISRQNDDETDRSLRKIRQSIQTEIHRVKNVDVVLAVVGTMKAGKSTSINAIVGREVLPNRSLPMTALPTLVRHVKGCQTPRLEFKKYKPVNELAEKLRKKISKIKHQKDRQKNTGAVDESMEELIQEIRSGNFSVKEKYEGEREVFQFLRQLNDLVRLSVYYDEMFPFGQYGSMPEFPCISVEFTHLAEQNARSGSFTLLDTPGPNEAGANSELFRRMLRTQLRDASAVVLVMDYTQINSVADQDMRDHIDVVARIAGDRLSVLVNKIDQRQRNDQDDQALKRMIVGLFQKIQLAEERIHPVSSSYAYLSARAGSETTAIIRSLHAASVAEDNAWMEDFWKEGGGGPVFKKIVCDDIKSGNEVQAGGRIKEVVEQLWKESKFDEVLENVIQRAFSRADQIVLDSAGAKLLDHLEWLVDALKPRKLALIGKGEDTRAIIARERRHISSVGETKKKMRTVAQKKMEKYRGELNRRLGHFQDEFENRVLIMVQNRKEISFDTEEEAKIFLEKVRVAAKKSLDEVEAGIKKMSDNFNAEMQKELDGSIQSIKNLNLGGRKGMLDYVAPPDPKSIKIDIHLPPEELAEITEKRRVVMEEQEGLWGGVKRFFGSILGQNDWGLDERTVSDGFKINGNNMYDKLRDYCQESAASINRSIDKGLDEVNNVISDFFDKFDKKIQDFVIGLEQGLRDKETKIKSEQEAIVSLLDSALGSLGNLKTDIDNWRKAFALQTEVASAGAT